MVCLRIPNTTTGSVASGPCTTRTVGITCTWPLLLRPEDGDRPWLTVECRNRCRCSITCNRSAWWQMRGIAAPGRPVVVRMTGRCRQKTKLFWLDCRPPSTCGVDIVHTQIRLLRDCVRCSNRRAWSRFRYTYTNNTVFRLLKL